MKIVYALLGVLLLVLAAGVIAKPVGSPCPTPGIEGMAQGCVIEVPKPDYVVQWIRIDNYTKGMVEIQALTVNIGADADKWSQTRMVITDVYGRNETDLSFNVPPLPHAGHSLHVFYYRCIGGRFAVHFLADARGEIDEKSEANNGNSAVGSCS